MQLSLDFNAPRPVRAEPPKATKTRTASAELEAAITHAELLRLLSYDPETGEFRWRVAVARRVRVGDVAGSRDFKGYLLIVLKSRRYKAHRLAWFYMTGAWPADQIDHINRNPADNRFANLREATQAENMRNQSTRTDNTSGVPGVWWDKGRGKWAAEVMLNSRKKHLGRFNKFEDAVATRKAAELKYFGQFAPNV